MVFALLSAEVRRLRTTKFWLWGLVAAVVSGGFIALLALVGPENFQPPMPGLATEDGTRLLLGMLGILAFVPALLGTSAVTAEYRHQTITSTYLFAPRRWSVLAAKLVVHAVAGFVYGLLVILCAGAGLVAVSVLRDVELGLPTGEIVVTLLRVAVAMTVYTVLGVAFGALLRNQVAALIVVGAYFYLGEFALLLIPGVNAVYPYLPGGASAALTGFTYLAEATASQTGGSAAVLLSAPAAALVLLGYAAVAAAIAVAVPLRRDVT